MHTYFLRAAKPFHKWGCPWSSGRVQEQELFIWYSNGEQEGNRERIRISYCVLGLSWQYPVLFPNSFSILPSTPRAKHPHPWQATLPAGSRVLCVERFKSFPLYPARPSWVTHSTWQEKSSLLILSGSSPPSSAAVESWAAPGWGLWPDHS